jgi:amino acid adenylation domain-containing protein
MGDHVNSVDYSPLNRPRAPSGNQVRPNNPFIEFKKEDVEQSIPARFEQIVEKYPNRLAVKTKTDELTYCALNQAANRIARVILDRLGEGEEPVALLLEHGAPIIAVILGVLKAGKVYVPLDPEFPQPRIQYILEDSSAKLILTNENNLPFAHQLADENHQILNIDQIEESGSSKDPDLSFSPDTLAWILYTSGSTGHPKGIMQNHRNVLHETMNYTNKAHICMDDRLVLVSSCSFADSVRTNNVALLNGSSLFPYDVKKEGLAGLADWLIDQKITIYRSVPTLFRNFAQTLSGKEEFPHLRLIYFAGEPVYKSDIALYRKHFPSTCIVINGLGSTESLTFRMYFINQDTQIESSNVPVGYALPDKEVLLLDESDQDVGFGRMGEISVKSQYLSPGYWGKPDLTQKAYFANPDGGEGRIYRTGDLGRMSPDGFLEHLGRKDFQVKIRGYRIEVSEIEMALLDLDVIEKAVVRALKDESGEQRLVAYFVAASGLSPTVSTLRRELVKTLPDYMIPSSFVALKSLPLTATGKVNRRALPEPGSDRPCLDNPFVPPRTPLEEKLAKMWAEILGIEQVGMNDDFLELGGDSLRVTQVISRVLHQLDLDVPYRVLFDAPTVADMAAVLAQHMGE